MAKTSPVRKAIKKNSNQRSHKGTMSAGSDQLIEQVRGLAWTGQHAAAIDSATQALSAPKIKIAVQMDLLDLRAESYIAIGKLDLAMKDARAMMKLAKSVGAGSPRPMLQAQALNRLALVQMRMGEIKAAVKTAKSALKVAQQSRQKSLIALSLMCLSRAQNRTQQNDIAAKNAQEAVLLFQQLGNASGAGRAYSALANAYFYLYRAEDSRLAAQTALELCRDAGDQYGIGDALNAMGVSHMDIAERIQYHQQALQAYEAAGYIGGKTSVWNLAYAYTDLGLYPRSRRLQSEIANISRTMGAKLDLAFALGNLIVPEINLGMFDAARLHLQEMEKLCPDFGDPAMDTWLASGLGRLAYAEGNFKTAIQHFKSAVKIGHGVKFIDEIGYLADLGRAYLASHDPVAALKATTKATDLHRARSFAKPDDFTSQEIWWRHTQVLLANKNYREAREALERTYELLLEGIRNIRDVGLRRNALNKVPENREFIQFWIKDGTKHKLSKERLFAHLAIESNLREPFQRLADTGLRLNALHTLERIQTFLVEEATELIGGERVMLILEKDGAREVAESILPLPSYQSGKGYEKAEDPKDVLKRIGKYLDQARQTRTVQLLLPKQSGLNRIISPLIAQNQVIGYIYVDMDLLYGSFDDTDRDMLGMLANQGAVALDNAGLLEGLERKVEERTEELNARVDELAILNSVGEAMAKTLDVRTVTRIVGDKVRDIFHAQGTSIMLLNTQTNLIHVLYEYDEEEGLVDYIEPFPLGIGMTSKVIKSRKPLLMGTILEQRANGSYMAPEIMENSSSDLVAESSMLVPIIVNDQVLGVAMVTSYKQNAFNQNDLSLLQTLSANMGVAIQNARLFEAEQERVAELAIINSVQSGLAAELDFQAIVDLVGDKIREIFNAQVVVLATFDTSKDLMYRHYVIEKGQRLYIEPRPIPNGWKDFIKNRQTWWVNTNFKGWLEERNSFEVPEDQMPKSVLSVPLIVGNLYGAISLQNLDTENAFSESDVRLLQTLAGSLSVALQNAQSFKAEQERVAELQIINSIQQGLAAELDFQAIVDLVGDKLSEVLKTGDLGISWYDEKTNLIHYLYEYEHGERLTISPRPPYPGGQFETILKTRKPILWNTPAEYTGDQLPGTDQSKSLVTIPIISSDRVLGSITIENYERENAFGDSELRLLTTIAASLGTALENARLFDETQQRNAELAIINSVQASLAAKLEMQAIYDAVGDKIREIFDAQVVMIVTHDKANDLAQFSYAIEKGERLYIESRPVGGITGHVIRTGQAVLINQNLAQREIEILGTPAIIPAGDDIKSRLDVPMMVGTEVKGCISLQNVDRENAFSESDLRLLTTLANSMSVALENARLFDETQRLFKAEQERVAELQIINSIQQGLAAELDFQAIIDLVGDKLRQTFNTGDISIAWYDARTNVIQTLYSYEHGQRFPPEPPTTPGSQAWLQLVATRQPLVLNSVAAQEAVGITTVPGTDQQKSMIRMPIIASDQIIGMIDLFSHERENAYSDDDVRLLQTVTTAMGVALENARLFDETQRLLQITEERNAELAIINSVQAALAAELNIQGIYDAVGDKIREIFQGKDVGIRIYDPAAKMEHFPYTYENGERIHISSEPVGEAGFGPLIYRTKETLIVNENLVEEAKKVGSYILSGTALPKSQVMVPLITGDQARGLIELVDMEHEYAFSESDVRLLQTLANSMSVALENARLFDETQRLLKVTEDRAAELAIINSIQAGLASKLDMQAIYELIGDKLSEVMNSLDIDIRLFSPETDQVIYPYMREMGRRIDVEPSSMRGMAKHVFETRQILLINEKLAERMAELGSTLVPGTQMEKSYLAVPIIVGDRALGMVSISNYEKENAFGESDVRLLQTVVSAMSVALENARLFDETQRLLKETEQRNAELAVINSIQEGVAAELDFQTIINLVGDKLRAVFNTGDIGIRWYDHIADMLHYYYEYEHGERLELPSRPPGTSPTWRKMVQTRQPLIMRTPADLEAIGVKVEPGTDTSLSGVIVPIIGSDRVLGAIILENYEREDAFGDSDVRLLTTVAASMGTALENARLFDETQRLLKETEERNTELAVINSVQQGLASKLEFQSVIDLVGDKITEIFNAQATLISLYLPASNQIDHRYLIERGERIRMGGPVPLDRFRQRVVETRRHWLINQEYSRIAAELGEAPVLEGEEPKSLLFVPMIVGTNVTGIISIQNLDVENAFSESDVRLLQTLVSAMSVSLESARLFDETQRLLKETEQRAQELAIINSVQQGLASKLDMQAIYDLVGDKIRDMFNAQSIIISSFDHEKQVARLEYAFEDGQRVYDDELLPFSPLNRHLIETRQPVVINENAVEESKRYGLKVIEGTQLAKSLIYVPFGTGTQVNGYFSLQNTDREQAFSDSDVRLLQTLAGSMGIAIENARLFNAEQQRAGELAAISTISQALVAETELDNLIQLIGSQTREIFGADIAYVALLDPQTNLIHFPYQYGEDFTTLKLGEGFTSKIIDSGEPLLINKNIRERRAQMGATLVGREALSYLGVPIKSGRETIGVLSVQSVTEEGVFDDDDLRLLTTIAANAGAAIHTAQLHAETQRRAREMATLAEIGSDIAASRELEPVLERIASHAKEILRVRDIAVYLRDGDMFNPAVALGTYTEEIKAAPVLLGRGISGNIANTGVAEFLNHPQRDPRRYHVPGTPEEDEEEEGLMCAPLISRGQTIGLLTVWRPWADGLFTQPDLDFLVGVARQTAIAIESARLYLETQRRAREMSALVEVGRDISSSLDASTVLEGIATHAKDLLNGDLSALFLPENDGKVFRAIAAVGDEAEELRNDIIRLGEGLLGDLARRKVGEIINDTNADPRTILIAGTVETPDEHMIAVPLLANDELKGMMAVWRHGKGSEFIEAELEFMNSLARQAVIAVQNAQLFEETQRLFKDAQEARAAAEQANKAKSTFLANMSHELRTPLNAIIGFTRIVRKKADGSLPPKQLENLDKVLTSSEHLLGLINTVLDIAKIEAGRMDVIASNFSISQLMDQCANLAAPLLKPQVKLEKQIDPGANIIYSDQDKIKQIVLNLLSNAAKFTHTGRITLAVEKQDSLLGISVTDTGIGISEEALSRIFEEFQQADTSTTRQYGGTGLGLAISRSLARLLGGDLVASSEEGKGSTFTLTIPVQYGRKPASISDTAPVSVQAADASTGADSSKKQILVIDDDPDAAYILQESLSQNEFAVLSAPDGHAGLQMARERQPDAILLDILMPETDGWQVLNDLKSDNTTAEIPVVLLTIVDKKALGFKLGAAAYLLKPLDPALVLEALRRVIGEKEHPHKRVLVVDDDPHIAEMLRQTLPESEFALDSAEDGEAGLQAIEAKRPDVVLLDLMMPKLDGFGVIETMRSDPELRSIPIIVISAKELTDAESKSLRDSVAFVMKKQGFDSDMLLEEINSVLKN